MATKKENVSEGEQRLRDEVQAIINNATNLYEGVRSDDYAAGVMSIIRQLQRVVK